MLVQTLSLAVLSASISLASASPFSFLSSTDLFSRSASISSGCSTTGPASCHNTTKETNLCCFESPGGLLLQTQFWDTNPVTGPSNSWTIHGLWPDHCDGTFSSNCDSSRDYTDISGLLTAQGAGATLNFMEEFWISNDESPEAFWEHEWATHGTCYSTLEPSCLPPGSPTGAEAVAFFQTVVALFQTLPTYTWLANAGITPSTTATHTLSSLTSALQAQSGFIPALSCTSGVLNAISWYFNVKGSVIDGVFVPINAPQAGTCPSSGIKYPPKVGATTTTGATTTPTTTTTSTATTTTTAGSIPTKATIHASQSGSLIGGLLSLGTWSTQTLATFTLTGTSTSFTLTSSKGNCGVSSGVFSCGSGVSQTPFSAVASGSNILLTSGGSTVWSSDGVPIGSTVYAVNTGSGHSQVYSLVIVGS